MGILGLLLVIFALSFLIETLVEFLFGELLERYAPKISWALKYVAVACSIAMALFYKFDLLYLLSEFAETHWQPLSLPSIPGMLISGIAIGKGSNYLHDFLKRFFVKPSVVDDLPK